MKNTVKIILCLLLAAVCFAPTAVFAEESASAAERDSIHFINPTAITVLGDYLYVADNVEDDKSALLCFAINGDTPKAEYTFEMDGKITGLSNDGENRIFAICKNRVVELELQINNPPKINKTFSNFEDKSDAEIVDFAYGYVANSATDKNYYAMTKQNVLQYNADQGKFIQFASLNGFTNTAGCLAVNDASAPYLYYLHDGTCDRYDLKLNQQDTDFAGKLQLTSGFVPAGMFKLSGKIALYNNGDIYVVEESTLHVDTVITLSLSALYGADCRILDIDSHGERLFVLNSKNQVDVFGKTESGYDATPAYTIGSDIVDKTVPTSYTSFTLVRPKGYPTNIVYKTNAQSSVTEIITDASEYVILGYENDDESHYYYVMVGDKFGWVKKSGGSETVPANDGKLTVIDNYLSNETYEYEAKFVSLNAVYVYELPRAGSKHIVVNQSANNRISLKVLQQFNEGDQIWYYVGYDGKTGFVKKQDVGMFRITTGTDVDKVDAIDNKKINSSLFSAVKLYLTPNLNDGETVVDKDGNGIKLYSGARVTLIKLEGNAAFVMRVNADGNADFGWVDASRLIDVHKMTTNAIVGLSLLAVAIAVATTLLIIFFKRKKKIKANKD